MVTINRQAPLSTLTVKASGPHRVVRSVGFPSRFPVDAQQKVSWFLRLRSVGLNLGVVLRWMLAVYRHVPHLREAFGNTVRWLWVLAYVSAFNKVGSLFWYRSSPWSCKRQARSQDGAVHIFCARQAPTSATRLGGAGRNHVRVRICFRGLGTARISKSITHPSRPVLAHLAQYEEANEAIIARTIFCYLLVSTPWSSLLWLLRLCCVFYWCFVYVFPAVTP